MTQPNRPALPGEPPAGDIQSDLLARLNFIGERTTPARRMNTIVKLLVHYRNTIYPWMHILQRADGSIVVTISQPPAGAE